jgi:hypothetical protein
MSDEKLILHHDDNLNISEFIDNMSKEELRAFIEKKELEKYGTKADNVPSKTSGHQKTA